jgi:formylglycine-generating enzyme required for sulfatase activity
MGLTTAQLSAVRARTGCPGCFTEETPAHTVTLSRYFVGKVPVTNAQYAAFLAATADPAGPTQHQGHYAGEPAGKNHTPANWGRSEYAERSFASDSPVVWVDWYDAYAYCAWAGLRMPSEAEWECAARGRDGRMYPWGDGAPDAGGVYRANYYQGTLFVSGSDDGSIYSSAVGRYGPGATAPRADGSSPFGALDMAGNVFQWVADWYAADTYATRTSFTDPQGPATGTQRVWRGGCYGFAEVHSAMRKRGSYYSGETTRLEDAGFRVAR